MQIIWYGTASIGMETDQGCRLLFDPFVEEPGGENPNSLSTFEGYENICITHGHFDHLREVPALLEKDRERKLRVFCGSVSESNLRRMAEDPRRNLACEIAGAFRRKSGKEDERIHVVKTGEIFSCGEFTVKVLQGRHAVPGGRLAAKIVFSAGMLRYCSNVPRIAAQCSVMKEGKQTLIYEVQAEGKKILVMGSLGVAEGEKYPTGADVLVLPYQGSGHLLREAVHAVHVLRPRKVILDHFDDAFPPLTGEIDTLVFQEWMAVHAPKIPVIPAGIRRENKNLKREREYGGG